MCESAPTGAASSGKKGYSWKDYNPCHQRNEYPAIVDMFVVDLSVEAFCWCHWELDATDQRGESARETPYLHRGLLLRASSLKSRLTVEKNSMLAVGASKFDSWHVVELHMDGDHSHGLICAYVSHHKPNRRRLHTHHRCNLSIQSQAFITYKLKTIKRPSIYMNKF